MELFAYINELAVVGTALLMIALGTIWYSPLFFGKIINTPTTTHTSDYITATHHVIFFGVLVTAYSVMLGIVSYFSTVAQILKVSPIFFTIATALFALALLSIYTVSERRSFSYFCVHAGFLFVVIVGGSYIIHAWPW
jgi:hypothetical protein